jgi:hypothetical protein
MKIFIDLKHWQVFLLTIGLWFLAELLGVMWFLSDSKTSNLPLILYYLILGTANTIYFLWLANVSNYLYNHYLNPDLKKEVSLLLLNILLAIGYIGSLLMITHNLWFSHPINQSNYDISQEPFPLTYVGIAVFVFFMSIFYSLNLFSKIIVLAESQLKTPESEYFNVYVMAVIFPIGIWFLQPRINRFS